MKASRLSIVTACIVVVVGLFTAPAKAHADTYQILDLPFAGNIFSYHIAIVGITASGAVVLDYMPLDFEGMHAGGPCNLPISTSPEHCYETWENGVMVNYSTTAPDLVYDNGAPCVTNTSFPSILTSMSICNNGHEVYEAVPAGSPQFIAEIFTGPDLADSLGVEDPHPSFFPGGLNSSGDFVYVIGGHVGFFGEIFEAVDLTTDQVPEPSSIVLVGTGLLVATGTLGHRLLRNKEA